jgi:hypothetical protein
LLAELPPWKSSDSNAIAGLLSPSSMGGEGVSAGVGTGRPRFRQWTHVNDLLAAGRDEQMAMIRPLHLRKKWHPRLRIQIRFRSSSTKKCPIEAE